MICVEINQYMVEENTEVFFVISRPHISVLNRWNTELLNAEIMSSNEMSCYVDVKSEKEYGDLSYQYTNVMEYAMKSCCSFDDGIFLLIRAGCSLAEYSKNSSQLDIRIHPNKVVGPQLNTNNTSCNV